MSLFEELPAGENPPEEVYALIEIPKGSRNKYEYDISAGAFFLDRVLYSPVHYPCDYGLIPRTWCDDNDPLDILVMVEEPTFTGCVVRAKPIGIMRMVDNEGIDDKILAVPMGEPRLEQYESIKDIPKHWLDEIRHFFTQYKLLEGKKAEVKEWLGAEEAKKAIKKAMERYLKKRGK